MPLDPQVIAFYGDSLNAIPDMSTFTVEGIRQAMDAVHNDKAQSPAVYSLQDKDIPCPCREMPKLTINNRNMLYVQADEVEIPMSAQMRALYILFLFNPNGIRITNLHDYRRQFTAIYRIVTTRTDYESCVGKLFDRSDSNHRNFYSLLSKVNGKIGAAFSDIEVCETFQISNVGNGLYRIKLRPEQFIHPQQSKWQEVMNMR